MFYKCISPQAFKSVHLVKMQKRLIFNFKRKRVLFIKEMAYNYQFERECGAIYRAGNIVFASQHILLSPFGNKIAAVNLERNEIKVLPFETRSNTQKICVSPDGKMLIAVDQEGYGVFFNLMASAVITHFNFHAQVTALSFSPDSKYFVVATEGGKLRIYSSPPLIRSFAPLSIFKKYTTLHSSNITHIIWTKDSRFFMTVSKDVTCKIMSLHKLSSQQFGEYEPITLTGFRKPMQLAFFSQNCERIFILTNDGKLYIWSWAQHKSQAYENLKKFQKRKLKGQRVEGVLEKEVTELEESKSLSPLEEKYIRGRFILEKTCQFQLEGGAYKIVSAAHQNGVLVVGLNNGSFSLFSVNTLQTIHAFKLTNSKINSLCISENGKWIGLASEEQQSLCVWQWATESFIIKQSGFDASVVSFSPDGDIVATGGREDGTIKLWKSENGFCFATFDDHQAPISDIAFLPKGNAIISASLDGTLRAFDLVKYRRFKKYDAPERAQLQCLALDNSGQLVVAGAREPYSVFIWSIKTAELVDILSGHQAPISSLQFQPNTQMLVTCSWDQSLRLWDIFNKKSRVQPLVHSSQLITFVFNPVQTNQLVSSTLNGDLSLWDVEEGELLSVIEAKRDIWGGRLKTDFKTSMNSTKNKHFTSVVYNPSGQLVIAGGNSRYLCIFEMRHRVLIQKISISSNRSLDGVLHKLNSKNQAEQGEDQDAYESDLSDQQNDILGEARRAQGQKVKRKAKIAVGVSRISFNPDASQFAVATTQGVQIYSKNIQAAFIPYEFDSEVSVEHIQIAMEEENSARAFIIACRLNEKELIRHTFWNGVHKLNQGCEFIQSIGSRDIARALLVLSEEMQNSQSPEYVIKVTNDLLMSRAEMLKSVNKKGELNSLLFGIRRAVQNYTNNYLDLSEWNTQLLKFTRKKIKSLMEKIEGKE